MRGLALLLLFMTYVPIAAWQPFCGILLWTWISIMNPHQIVWGIGSTLPYAMIAGVACLGGWCLSREPKLPPRNATTVALIGLMITISISTAFALVPELAYSKWDRVFKTLLMTILSLTLITNRVRIHAFIWILVLSLGYYGAKGGLFAIITGGNFRVYGPPNSYIGDNNHLAAALGMTIPLMHYLQQQSRLLWVRIGLIALELLSFGAALFSYSRGSFLGLLAMGGLLWLRGKHKLVSAVMLGGIVAAVALAAPPQWFARMESIQHYGEDDSAMSRLAIWGVALKIFRDHPLFGGGFRATYSQAVVNKYEPGGISRAVHNSHLEVLVETGIFGLAFHLTLILSTFIYGSRIRKLTKRRPELEWAYTLASSLQVAVVGYTVSGSFLSLGYYDGWYDLAIAMSALYCIVVRATNPASADNAQTELPAAVSLAAPTPLGLRRGKPAHG